MNRAPSNRIRNGENMDDIKVRAMRWLTTYGHEGIATVLVEGLLAALKEAEAKLERRKDKIMRLCKEEKEA